MSRHRSAPRPGPWPLAALGLACVAVALWRAQVVDAQMTEVTDGTRGFLLVTLGHDAPLLAIVLAWLAGAAAVSRPGLRCAMSAAALAALAIGAFDAALLALTGMRLHATDILKFGGETGAIGDIAGALLRLLGGVPSALVLAAALVCCLALRPRRASRGLAGVLIAGAAASTLAAHWLPATPPGFVLDESLVNLVELQRRQTVNLPYSDEFIRRLPVGDAPADCSPGQARRPDVLVIAVESLSSYQSALLGGPMQALPGLDAFARRHAWIPDFHANGFTTDQGLIALLTGETPLPTPGRYASLQAFDGFGRGPHSVPRALAAAGYHSAFFTTGDLGFLDKTPWLERLGFDQHEGSDAEFYRGWPRGAFDAAEDEALYRRLRQWMKDAPHPFFAFALTVQSHPPFVDAASGRFDEAAVMRAVDRSLAAFLQSLEADGFLEHGIVVVTGDHRSMTPLHPEELERFGERASSRVPLVVAGAGMPRGAVAGAFQQTDLLASLRDLTAAGACAGPGEGRFLRAVPVPAQFVLHVRGDRRNRVDVYFGAGQGAIVLAGDESVWRGARPPGWQAIAADVHRQRAARAPLASDVPGMLRLLGR